MRLVVIGGVAAGTKAASRARRVNPDLEITIYQEEPEISISECGLPYFLSGVVEARDELIARTPEKFAEKDVEVLVRHRVERIDPENKTLTVRDLGADEEFEDSYDRLIISTGATAVLPPIDGAELDGVFALRFLTDADDIMEYIRERSPERAAVIGGGYIGLEVAESLKEIGIDTTIVEVDDRVGARIGRPSDLLGLGRRSRFVAGVDVGGGARTADVSRAARDAFQRQRQSRMRGMEGEALQFGGFGAYAI